MVSYLQVGVPLIQEVEKNTFCLWMTIFSREKDETLFFANNAS